VKISENVKLFRTKSGFSQQELAKRIGVSQQMIFAIEKGYSVPSVVVLVTMSDILQTASNYEIAVKGKNRCNPHAYYSTRPDNRWADWLDVAAYEISYMDGSSSDTYFPLNSLRLHTFTTI